VHDTRRTRLVLGVLLAAALALITIDYRGGITSPLKSTTWQAALMRSPARESWITGVAQAA